jgi:hypothetical protein
MLKIRNMATMRNFDFIFGKFRESVLVEMTHN